MQYAGMLLSTGLAVTEIHMPQLRYYSAGPYGLCRQFFWCKSNVYISIALFFFFFSLSLSLFSFCRFYIIYREKLTDYYLFCFLFSFLEFFSFICMLVCVVYGDVFKRLEK